MDTEEIKKIEKKIAGFTEKIFQDKCKNICGEIENSMGCCHCCSSAEGFLPKDRDFLVSVKKINKNVKEFEWTGNYPRIKVNKLKDKYNFTEEKGFLENGCKLPRKYRSAVCLCEACIKVKNKVEKEFGYDYDTIFNALREFIIKLREKKYE